MHAQHILRTRGRCGDLVDIQVGCVGRQYCPRLADCVELAEHLFLHIHIFIHSLDHKIAIGERFKGQRRRQQRHHAFNLFGGKTPLCRAGFVIFPDNPDAAVQIFLHHLHDGDRNALGEEVHRNATAHGSGTDDADFLNFTQRKVFRQAIDLGGLPFGKEHVPLRRRLGTTHQFHEFGAFKGHAFIKRQFRRGLDTGEVGIRGFEPFPLACIGRLELLDNGDVALHRQITGSPRADGDKLLRIGNGIVGKTVFTRDAVDKAHRQGLGRAHRFAKRAHGSSCLNAHHARQTLRSTGTRQQAKLDLRHAQLRRRHGNAVVADQRCFQAAAKSCPMDRADDRLGRGFDCPENLIEIGTLGWLAKFGDIRTRDEGATVAAQNHRFDLGIVQALIHPVRKPLANMPGQCVYGRIVDDNHEDIADFLGRHGLHSELLNSGF